MVLLGSKAPGRTVEQHDVFFGIGQTLRSLIPDMRTFWPEAGSSLHIDGWREVTYVDGHQVDVQMNLEAETRLRSRKRLFFINLGGYRTGILEEQHYTLLTVQEDRKGAVKTSVMTDFFKQQSIAAIKSASAHIDEKYGIDVDEVYQIEDVLAPAAKSKYRILLIPASSGKTDKIHLGYHKLDKV